MSTSRMKWWMWLGPIAFVGLVFVWTRYNTIQVANAYIVAPAGDAPAVMYFTVENHEFGIEEGRSVPGCRSDTLLGVTTNAANAAQLHRTAMDMAPTNVVVPETDDDSAMSGDTMAMPGHDFDSNTITEHAMMQPVERVPIPGCSAFPFAPGGHHVMLIGPKPLRRGEMVDVTFRFAYAANVAVKAKVISYADVDRVLPNILGNAQ